MKRYSYLFLVSAILFPMDGNALEVNDVTLKVYMLYQNDDNENEFEFQGIQSDGTIHDNRCGGTVYKVKSSTVALASRKFSLATTALVSGLKISFRETGICSGSDRMEVSWIQLKTD